ncbi:MAG: NACHT domain-containing protein [Methylovulum sp.]|nr:NACHT domain-containing protein [Methylovulum sp.]
MAILHKLSSWAIEANATFEIFGIKEPLSLETAWIEMKAFVQENRINDENDLETALKRYHSWNARSIPHDAKKIDSITIGQFVKRAVVIAGPGIGKTTLLKRLALFYAKSGNPVLRVRLRDIATRMKNDGLGFEQSVIERGLDGSGVTAEELRRANLENLVLLCDGLDECGNAQNNITEGIINFSTGHPQCRIIITTRPIGYDSTLLKSWRHYELVPLEASSTKKHLSTLLSGIFDKNSSEFTQAISFAETQLKQRHVETVVTKSPMLLGFLLALSLKNKSVGTTRTELYQRLFELIEDAPSQRHEKGEVSSAVMVRFLEILGWHLQLNPHKTFKKTLAWCASVMASELQQSRLQAQDTCEQCARRWQDLGMLERVRFQTEEAITFVHKTFGEYAAARYLATLEPEVQSQAFNSHSNDAFWAETIKFACSMGLVEKAIDAVLNKQSKLSVNDVKHAAEFLSESEARIDNTVVTRLVDCGWNFVMSRRRWDALEAGVLLSSIAAKYPEVVGHRAKAGLSHPQPWARLAAWVCVTAAGSQYYDYQAMLDIFKALPSKDYRFERLHKGVLWIGDPRPKIIESFMLSATKAVLTFYPEPNGLAVLDDVLTQNIGLTFGHTIGFKSAMSAILRRYGISIPENYSINIPQWTSNQRENWRDHYLNLLDALDDPSVVINDVEPIKENSVLMQLSGFMDASSHWHTYAGDLWKWEFDKNADSVKEVLQAVIAISGLERDRLISEVRIHRTMINSQDDDGFSFYNGLVHVDTVVDWQLAKQLPLSLSNLETAILGRSDWLIILAANLLEQKASKEELLPILERLLEKGEGITLDVAVYFASLFEPQETLKLLCQRLRRSMTNGCEALFKKLSKFVDILKPEEIFQFLQNGLLCTNPKVAIAAAEFSAQIVNQKAMDITALLSEAHQHWLEHEEPYPVSGGVIPDSPRLLLVKAMLLAGAVDDNVLIEMASDRRSDVREVSEEALFERLEQSEPFRDLFLNSIFSGKLELNLLTQALKKKIFFSAHQCVLIREKLESDDATIRYAAIRILAEPYSTADEIELYARRMTADPEQEIREIAFELLR